MDIYLRLGCCNIWGTIIVISSMVMVIVIVVIVIVVGSGSSVVSMHKLTWITWSSWVGRRREEKAFIVLELLDI